MFGDIIRHKQRRIVWNKDICILFKSTYHDSLLSTSSALRLCSWVASELAAASNSVHLKYETKSFGDWPTLKTVNLSVFWWNVLKYLSLTFHVHQFLSVQFLLEPAFHRKMTKSRRNVVSSITIFISFPISRSIVYLRLVVLKKLSCFFCSVLKLFQGS
jgi:hypothetical protein